VVILGCGSVSRCLQPLLLRHLDMDFRDLTVADMAGAAIDPGLRGAGAQFERLELTPGNLGTELARLAGRGDLIIDLTFNVGTIDIVQVARDLGALYVNASLEVWDPYDTTSVSLTRRTLYARHMDLRRATAGWGGKGPTAVLDHGANPGLVSHWAKRGLEDLATEILKTDQPLTAERRQWTEDCLAATDYARLAQVLGVRAIHISERDTQISSRPKEPGEFVGTWSPTGCHEEALCAPAELGWGTHEIHLPYGALTHPEGPRNQICLSQLGADTFVRSWVPTYGPITGMLVRHGEAFTISDWLTVWEEADRPRALYRPTVHYAYVLPDAMAASLAEAGMNGCQMQDRWRVMTDEEIISGRDELGVLLLGHDLNGWWTGSQLTIEQARALTPGQNATTLQVAASVLAAAGWMLAHPDRGLCLPEQLDHEFVLDVAGPYLGACPSLQTDWDPLDDLARHPFAAYRRRPRPADPWQFTSAILVNPQ
jgi:homospermidine synthase